MVERALEESRHKAALSTDTRIRHSLTNVYGTAWHSLAHLRPIAATGQEGVGDSSWACSAPAFVLLYSPKGRSRGPCTSWSSRPPSEPYRRAVYTSSNDPPWPRSPSGVADLDTVACTRSRSYPVIEIMSFRVQGSRTRTGRGLQVEIR